LSRSQRLTTVLVLNLALVAGLVAVGAIAHSLAVLAEGGDYLLDAAAIGVAIIALWLSTTNAKSKRRSYPNATTIAALINAGWLLTLELIVSAAAIDRLATRTPQVAGLPVLIVSAIAAIVMIAGALVLHADSTSRDSDDEDLSVAAVLLDTVADAAAAAGVAVTGGIILAVRGWYWLDPAVALLIAIIISWHAAALVRKALRELRSQQAAQRADLARPAENAEN
jgi:cobalt-zinc-cadmium efflux system protein